MSFQKKIQHIQTLQDEINSHGKLADDVLKSINYKFRLEWNYNSNIMEGNSLTRQETRSVMIGNITVGGKPLKDVLEMKGHDEVVKQILGMGQGELNISEGRIREIHKLIMYEEAAEEQRKIGVWKTENNYLYNYKNEKVDFVSVDEVKDRMHQLMNWLSAEKEKISRKDKTALHPIALAFKFHLDYITIHPFYDGNGRTARILTNLVLVAYGYPPLYIKLDEKNRYYRYLADVQEYGGPPDLFYEFMGDLLIRSQQLVLNAIAGKPIEEQDDIDKEIAIWKKGLGNTTVDALQKSDNIIYTLYQTSIFPLFDLFLRKYIQFKEMYETMKIEGSVNDHLGVTKRYIDFVVNDTYNVPTNFISEDDSKLSTVDLQIYFLEFKQNGTDTFNTKVSIECDFNKYNWYIKINENLKKIEKVYTDILTEKEITNIVNDMVKQTLETLKQRTYKN